MNCWSFWRQLEPWLNMLISCLLAFHVPCVSLNVLYLFCSAWWSPCVSWLNSNGMLLRPSSVFCFAFPASPLSMSRSPPLFSLLPPPFFFLFASGLTPALACAPSREVADCLALILATMMPFCSPCSSGAPSPGSLLKQLPHQVGKGPGSGPRGPRSPRNPSGPSSEGTTENDSEDSETFWPLRTASLPSYLQQCTWTLHPWPPHGMM